MALIIYILLICLGWLVKKNKCLFLLMSAFLFIILAFRTGGADYDVYISRFNWFSEFSGFTEILFTLFISFFHNLNLSFENFLQLSALLCLIAPLYLINKEAEYPCRVLSIYMLYSFPVDGIQIRSTLAFGVVLIGFVYLKKNIKKSELIFASSIVIATLLHSASLLYIVFLPINRLTKKDINFKIVAIFISELFTVFVFKNYFLNYLSGMGNQNITYLLSHAANDNYRIFMYITKSIIMFLTESLLLFLYERNYIIKSDQSAYNLAFVKKLNLISLFIIPLYFFTVDLYRIQRYLMIFSLIIIFGSKLRGEKNNKLVYIILSLIGFGIIYYLFMYRSTDYTTTIVPLLKNNALF